MHSTTSNPCTGAYSAQTPSYHVRLTIDAKDESTKLFNQDNKSDVCSCDTIINKIGKTYFCCASTVRESHPFRCRSPICEFTTAGCIMGLAATAFCWIPGTFLWSLPTATAEMVTGGQVLVGLSAGTTCFTSVVCGPPIAFLYNCMEVDGSWCFEKY